MPDIRASLACNLDANLLLACLPLFESERVQAIEWSFDTLFALEETPPWFLDLLKEFSEANRLVGHGVFFSLFSGRWTPEQQAWLTQLETRSLEFTFDHVTEHFGFMTGADFHSGAPLSIPFTPATLALGQDRLKRIQQASRCPVGLENLAFSYSLDEVHRQGDFLNRLLEPVNGFLILDLHNLYCQLQNFDVAFSELLRQYPLDRVREIHVSGGSWEQSLTFPEKKIRRDTHDDAVPTDVFALLERTMPQCPNLRYVVLEQLGTGLDTPEKRAAFQHDFRTLDRLVERQNRRSVTTPTNSFLPSLPVSADAPPLEDLSLQQQQTELSRILETSADWQQAQARLQTSTLAHSAWEIERWEPCMLETALAIAQKWKNGAASPALP